LSNEWNVVGGHGDIERIDYMMEKYFLLNDQVFIFHPDTHEVFRVDTQHIKRLDHPQEMMALRLSAMEITRQQAERVAPTLESLLCHSS